MIVWCKELSDRLSKLGITNELFSRFVDDMTLLPTIIPPGWKLENKSLKFHAELVESDMEVEDDVRTMNIIQKVGNSICEEIQVTYDVPSNYDDKKVPILDLKAGLDKNNLIEFTFYKKPVSSKLVTFKDSAASMQQKMATLTQQCFMRLHNTSENIPQTTLITILNDFMQELCSSGYSENDRLNILKGGINTYKKLKMSELLKQRPFYRPNSYRKYERKNEKAKKIKTWFQGKKCDSNFKSVMFIDATPGDKLLKMIKQTEEKYQIAPDHRIKIVSKSGSKLVNLFERNNPFETNCEDIKCKPCEKANGDFKLSKCRLNNVCYEARCETCSQKGKNKIYTGETARNLHIRSKEHYNDCENQKKNSWMLKHIKNDHEGEEKQ